MPPAFLFDLSGIDLNHVLFGPEEIRKVNLQRGDMEHLDAVVWADGPAGSIIGYKDVRENEFWVPGHIPGRPLLPGVIMIEAGAQLAGFFTRKYVGWEGFIGFGGATDIRFRQPVPPGKRLYLLVQKMWERHRRIESKVQGVVDGTLAFEATIIGTQM
jgi:3-hydroxyacyl-[acyl-carrier-protein] dehydratase